MQIKVLRHLTHCSQRYLDVAKAFLSPISQNQHNLTLFLPFLKHRLPVLLYIKMIFATTFAYFLKSDKLVGVFSFWRRGERVGLKMPYIAFIYISVAKSMTTREMEIWSSCVARWKTDALISLEVSPKVNKSISKGRASR